MGRPIAKRGDRIVGLDTHIVMVVSSAGPIPTPTVFPFCGIIQHEVSSTFFVDNQPVATVGSAADNLPVHMPLGGPFLRPPANIGKIVGGSTSVFVDNKPCARALDPAICCNDPIDTDTGHVFAAGVVLVG